MSNIFAVSSLVSFLHINNVSCTFPLLQVSFLRTLSLSYFLSCIIFWFVLARFSTFHYVSFLFHLFWCVGFHFLCYFLCSFTFYFVHLLFDSPHSYPFPSSFLLYIFFFLLTASHLFSFFLLLPLFSLLDSTFTFFFLFCVSLFFVYLFPSLPSSFTFPFPFSSLILFPLLLPCFQSVEGK